MPVDLSQHVIDPKSSDQDASKKTEGLELGAVDKLLVGIFAGRDGGGEDFPNSPRPPLFFSLRYPITIIMILLDQ